MKVLILGGNGMLGHKLFQKWQLKFDVWMTLRSDVTNFKDVKIFSSDKIIGNVDAENIQSVSLAVDKIKPDVIFNAIGIIKQLPTSKNVVRTLNVNSIFPHLLAEIAAKNNARLINISTDCVFNGKKGNYTEEDYPDAEDLYGKSKNFGEVVEGNCLTIRTSIIGRELGTSHSLIDWFLNNRSQKVKGFKNAVYTGFPTVVMADILSDIILKHPKLRGLYHISSEKINKFDLLNLVKKSFNKNIEIEPDEEFHIDRSLNSDKFRRATGFEPLEWTKMIKIMAEDAKIFAEY